MKIAKLAPSASFAAAQRPSSLLMLGVIARSHEMQGDVGFPAYNPAVVARLNVENVAGSHLDDAAVIHGRGGASGNDHPDVLHRATLLSDAFANVNGPFPTRLIGRAPNRHSAQMHNFEFALFKGADFVWVFKSFHDDFVHEFLQGYLQDSMTAQ